MAANSSRVLFSMLILSSLLSSSFAGGGRRMAVDKPPATSSIQEISKRTSEEEVATVLCRRILRVRTDDYENYEPTPTLSKPPFKLIPN
ncbi:hypothetical protein KSP40_PGU012064 [Platanthera guangdongensis]|uniref:Uncharacterized protein n=1 Tax=Platanthera guangdongensis TaxID=2320717 RepID=A0ABR2MRW5_9ASPA